MFYFFSTYLENLVQSALLGELHRGQTMLMQIVFSYNGMTLVATSDMMDDRVLRTYVYKEQLVLTA